MIIFVGGLIGAGKSTIAKGIASHFDFPYFDVDEIKKVVYRKDPDYEKNLREGIPFRDETRMEVFQMVCDDLETLVRSIRILSLMKPCTKGKFATFCMMKPSV